MSSNYKEGQELFDVFLSFRGDIRNGFTSHLYYGLRNSQVRVFKDNVSLPTGEVIKDELAKAIRHSKISIPILSRNYAHSKWCLMELAWMMEFRTTTNHTVLPIFYDVAPRDVRHQTGACKDAFDKHAREHDQETVAGWRKALSDVGQLKGLAPSDTNGDEGELVKTVVADVMEKLKKNHVIPIIDYSPPAELDIQALSSKQKYIFLNMACFWIGKLKYAPNYVWEDHFNSSVSHEIEELERHSSLGIKIKDYRYWMDDKLRDRARTFVKREYNDAGKQVWSWSSREGTQRLMENKFLPQLEAICLDGDQLDGTEKCFYFRPNTEKCFKAEQLRNLPKLKFIEIRGADLAGNFQGALQKVSYLKVDGPFKHTIKNLSLENIVVLSLSYSGVGDDWKWSNMKAASKMKYLNLSHCHELKRGPNLSLFPNLERLCVNGCDQLVSVALGDLQSLKYLDASNCKSLQDVHGLDRLESLNWLDISNCKLIQGLPDLSKLKKLEVLEAEGCIALQRLKGVEGLEEALEEFNIVGCAAMKQLPDVSNLKHLPSSKFRTSETEKIERERARELSLFLIVLYFGWLIMLVIIYVLVPIGFGLFFRYLYVSLM